MAPAHESDLPKPPPNDDNVCYTVLIRLPFPRGAFVDPPKMKWNAAKDRELWHSLSEASSKARDLDWQATADRFDVSLAFLTQQAAWLYERQLSQVRAQLRKVNKPSLAGTSPTPNSTSGSGMVAGHTMTKGGSGGSRVLSSLPHRPKERTISRGEGSMETPIVAREHPMSRTASNNTVTHIKPDLLHASPHFTTERHSSFDKSSREISRHSTEVLQQDKPHSLDGETSLPAMASSSSSPSSSDSNAPHPMPRSRAFASRRPRYPSTKAPLKPLSDADEEDEDAAPFLPFSAARTTTPPPPNDPGATVKISPRGPPPAHQLAPQSPAKHRQALVARTPHSSSSSAQSQPQSQNRAQHNPLSTLSPKQRRAAKEESEGTPSMGSSFSDLDDASVTQSALEEALANEMPQGAIGSRMSTISQALRSRYL